MALAPFFERVFGALGGHLAISRESLTTALQGVTVGINLGDDLQQNDIWIAELATNLVARLYPRIAITGPDVQASKLRDLALSINPNIEFMGNTPNTATIAVGVGDTRGELFPSASGWVARLNHKAAKRSGPSNPYSAGSAASFACAELFRQIFLKTSPERDISVSLIKFDRTTGAAWELKPTDLGDVLFVGAGAVGNAALWALGRDKKLRGEITVVDPEAVELSNLQRYVLAQNVDIGKAKTELAERELKNTKLKVKTAQLKLDKFAETPKNRKIPTTVVSVDNVDGRRVAQALLPRLVINGWTGDHGLGSSWHVFSHDAACLACLYHPRARGVSATEQAAKALGLTPDRAALLWVTHQPLSDADIHAAADALGVKESVLNPWRGRYLGDFYTDVVCGAVPLDVTGVGRVEMVPLAHQSALAGLLMATELLKRTQTSLEKLSQRETLVSWDDIIRPPPSIWKKPRPREPGCICGDEIYQSVYRKKWRLPS